MIGKLVVVGVGLIGGSLALALRKRSAVREVVGIGRTRGNLERAVALGIAHRVYTLDEAWTQELADADIVLVATPVAQMPSLFRTMAGALGRTTVVTDAGSTKQDVVAAARAAFGDELSRFVPAHPIAGTEHSGADSAFATLYADRSVIIAPLSETAAGALERVRAMWQECGATIMTLDPERHDAIFAAVSHAPHVLAFALVDELAQRSDADAYFLHAGSGLRDFTRLASSNAEMWRDICAANRIAVRAELAAFQSALSRIDALLAADDRDGLAAVFDRARSAREAWLARSAAGACGEPS